MAKYLGKSMRPHNYYAGLVYDDDIGCIIDINTFNILFYKMIQKKYDKHNESEQMVDNETRQIRHINIENNLNHHHIRKIKKIKIKIIHDNIHSIQIDGKSLEILQPRSDHNVINDTILNCTNMNDSDIQDSTEFRIPYDNHYITSMIHLIILIIFSYLIVDNKIKNHMMVNVNFVKSKCDKIMKFVF